jgi:FlaA1/EpsC-like NDP-sugar epimerase
VRAERDRCSLLQMLDTNLLKTRRLCGWLREGGFRGRFFCVSTDKAANPTNFLGASKRLMEQLVFAQDTLPGAITTSARFANVAFSNGSLLWGFLQRLLHGQPLATPRDTRRYFVTPREAGQLCLLAATVAKDRHVVIPRLFAARDLAALTDVAALVVRMHGRVPRFHDDAASAKRAAANAAATGEHPILVVPRDTGGEKAFEEFVATGEEAVDIGLAELRAIAMPRARVDGLAELLDAIEADLDRDTGALHTAELAARIAALVPQFAHAASDRHLDQRM